MGEMLGESEMPIFEHSNTYLSMQYRDAAQAIHI